MANADVMKNNLKKSRENRGNENGGGNAEL